MRAIALILIVLLAGCGEMPVKRRDVKTAGDMIKNVEATLGRIDYNLRRIADALEPKEETGCTWETIKGTWEEVEGRTVDARYS